MDSISLSPENIKDLADCKVGETIDLVIPVKVTANDPTSGLQAEVTGGAKTEYKEESEESPDEEAAEGKEEEAIPKKKGKGVAIILGS